MPFGRYGIATYGTAIFSSFATGFWGICFDCRILAMLSYTLKKKNAKIIARRCWATYLCNVERKKQTFRRKEKTKTKNNNN